MAADGAIHLPHPRPGTAAAIGLPMLIFPCLFLSWPLYLHPPPVSS